MTEPKDLPCHSLSGDNACRQAGGDARAGLSREAAARLLAGPRPDGRPEAKRRPLFTVLLRQLASPLLYIPFVAAVRVVIDREFQQGSKRS